MHHAAVRTGFWLQVVGDHLWDWGMHHAHRSYASRWVLFRRRYTE